MVKLPANAYEGIVIAINPYVTEDEKLIQNIQLPANAYEGIVIAINPYVTEDEKLIQNIQMESKTLNVIGKTWANGTVSVDSTTGNDTLFVVTWTMQKPLIILQDPKGKEYDTSDFKEHKQNSQTSHLRILGIAEAGTWTYRLLNNQAQPQFLSVTLTTAATNPSIIPVMAAAYRSQNTAQYINPGIVHAYVREEDMLIVNIDIIVIIELEDGQQVISELLDNGAVTKLLFWISAIGLNPPRPEVKEDLAEAQLEDVSRLTSGGSFTVSGAPPAGNNTPLFGPSKITGLEAEVKGGPVHLSWTAPGSTFDKGKGNVSAVSHPVCVPAANYTIRISKSSQKLQHDFDHAADRTSKEAGSKETFGFKAEHFKIENGTKIFITIKGKEESHLISEVKRAISFTAPQDSSIPALGINISATSLLESKALNVTGKTWANGTVFVNSTTGNDTVFVVTWTMQKPQIILQDPKGKEYDTSDFKEHKQNSRTSHLRILGIAETGTWTYRLLNNQAQPQLISVTMITGARNPSILPVTAAAYRSQNTAQHINPGTVHAKVWEEYVIGLNPPRPEVKDLAEAQLEDVSRLTSGRSFTVSGAPPAGDNTPLLPLSKITGLEAEVQGGPVHLSWTAPGSTLDKGKAANYTIRRSKSFQKLQHDFDRAADLTSKEAGSKETFGFKAEHFKVENGTKIFTAIKGNNESHLISEVKLAIRFTAPQDSSIPALGINISATSLAIWGLVMILSVI
ncbi:PREDICTED: uncharacterized protein LOC105991876 [Dipodomys ordii]|uniref:Uncharacterized protein LOC105991876 n=1 Tax=Dipodomys ordii TaxID=10020 RepID=A0A1S3FW59_DIPOR|nr:PREDICTED: uncharacterized protein LOC105991876 [Dipodomys ordii]